MPHLFRKSLVVFFAVLWTLFAAECYLRIFAPAAILPRFIEKGPHGIRRNIPGERYVHVSPDYRVDFSINEQGHRDPRRFEMPKPDDLSRIVLLGDSFAMGYGVSYEDSVPARLEASLETFLGPTEVINLGVSGFGTAEQLIVLENDGWSYEPDLVIGYWHQSDLQDNVRSQLYELAGADLLRKNDTYLPAVALRTWLFSFPVYRWIAVHSQFYGWLRDGVGKLSRELLFTVNDLRSESASADDVDADVDVIPNNVRLSLALLERIRTSCMSRDVPFLIAEIPANLGPGIYESTFPYEDMRLLGYSFDVVDPIPLFEHAHETNDGALVYWQKSAGHWTPLGASLMSDAIVEHVRNSR